MFGDETTSDSVRPSSPPVDQSGSEKPVFFDPDLRPAVDKTDPGLDEQASLSSDLVFDPTATGAFPIDLSEPQEWSTEADLGVDQDSASTTEGSIIDLTKPAPSFPILFDPNEEPVGVDVAFPSDEGWLQQSLFSVDSNDTPAATEDGSSSDVTGRSLADRLNYGVVENIEDIRWFHRPIIWLVFGLLSVLILFVILLLQNNASVDAAAGRTIVATIRS